MMAGLLEWCILIVLNWQVGRLGTSRTSRTPIFRARKCLLDTSHKGSCRTHSSFYCSILICIVIVRAFRNPFGPPWVDYKQDNLCTLRDHRVIAIQKSIRSKCLRACWDMYRVHNRMSMQMREAGTFPRMSETSETLQKYVILVMFQLLAGIFGDVSTISRNSGKI